MTRISLLVGLFISVLYYSPINAQPVISPKEHFGFDIGDNYQLANYTQTAAYYEKLAQQSDRLKLINIGKTEEGRTQYMLLISSPSNLQQLEKYQQISKKLAFAKELDDASAKSLANEGKAVVWIDGGLHATEVVGIHQLIETAYQLLSRDDQETMRILDNTIILMVHANPDGQELVSNWYMMRQDSLKRKTDIPRLYQKYIGHDNNRDFYMANMSESWNMNKQLYLEWLPQIMYNHHQSGPPGSVVAGPPYRDPFNYVFDPLMVTGIDALGAAMVSRLNKENKPGFTRLTGSSFSTWYNGGLRTTTQYHNMIGLLTEIIGSPTPMDVPLVPDRLVPNGATPNPVKPQRWFFKQSIDYSVSLNYAVLDYAARYKDDVLFNMYKMGKNAITQGNQDHWTLYPKYIDSIKSHYNNDIKIGKINVQANDQGYYGRQPAIPISYYDGIFKNPAYRDPRAYIISANQPDFPTAVKFINALIKTGIEIHQATADFNAMGKSYPEGSYVIKTSQAFRAHVLDMFEPQNYPNDFQYPGGPPVRPYDAAGWTLAYQMDIKFDRILDHLDGPFKLLPLGELQKAPVKAFQLAKAGYLLSAYENDIFTVVNDLLQAKIEVFRIADSTQQVPAGSFYVAAAGTDILKKSANSLGITIVPTSTTPKNMKKIQPSRIALFDQYGGSMPSGWVRWLMEQYHFPFQVVYPKDIDNGDLHKNYDIILFISSGIPKANGSVERYSARMPETKDIPSEYHSRLGTITIEKSVPRLKAFLANGGKILTTGSSTDLSYHLGLPVKDALTFMDKDGKEKPLLNTDYYIPGSLLLTTVDKNQSTNWGMHDQATVVFSNSPAFRLTPTAYNGSIKPLAWFGKKEVLRSGWAWGQSYLKDALVGFEASVGKGTFYAFGPEITFRAQPHGTFKWLFNTLYTYQH